MLASRLERWKELAEELEHDLMAVRIDEVRRLLALPAGEHDADALGLFGDAWDLSSKLCQVLKKIELRQRGT